MTKRKPDPFHLKKKLELAYDQGFFDGYMDSCDIWERVCEITPGVGPVLQKRMLDAVKAMATQRALEKIRKEQ
jgi:hypothetical protein